MSEQSIWAGWKLTSPIQASADGEASRRYQRAREKFKELYSALNQIEARVPGAAAGQLGLVFSEQAISDAFEALHTITSPQKLRQQHNFLVKGLEHGARELNWQVSIPSPMVTLPRKSPQVTTYSFSQLHSWDTAVNRHDQLLPPTNLHQGELKKWLAGRFLFQLIREGALLNKEWLKEVPTAVVDGVAFEQNTAYLTLKKELQVERSGSKKKTTSHPANFDESPNNVLVYEQQYQYRRLFLSPMSQLLLLNYYQQCGRIWPPSDSAETYLLYYAKRLSSELARVRLTALLSVAKTSASLEMSPLLTHYASQADASLSLRPSTWHRLVSRQRVFITTDEVTDDTEDTQPAFTVFPAHSGTYPDQLKQLRQLQACFAISSSRKTGKAKAIANIDSFLATPEQNGVMVTLLATWCKTLIRTGGRVKSKLTISTVATYLSIIARPLITHEHTIDELEIATTDEWEKLYETVLNDAKTPASRIRTQSRLRDFHHYLSNFYAVPPIAFEAAGQQQRRVDVNIITPAEYRRAIAMIESSKQTKRFKTMQQLALILGYRLGLRRNECASLLLHDIAYLPDRPEISGDVIVRANTFHSGKSYSATRRLPLWLLMPEERALLTDWVQQRRGEVMTLSGEKQLLFCRSGDGNSLLKDNMLFKPIQIALKAVSGDKNLRYHHLRHSFVTFTLLRLLERGPRELLSSEWATDDNGQIAIPNVSVDISDLAGLPPLSRPSRKRLWQLALWAGHASPDETLSSYSHSLDWVLGKTLSRRFDLALNIDQQLTLLSLPSKTALTSWRHRRGLKDPTRGSELLQHLQDQWHDFMADPFNKTAWKPYHASSQNPLNRFIKPGYGRPDAILIYQSLRLTEQLERSGMSFNAAAKQSAKRYALDPSSVRRWLNNGKIFMETTTSRKKKRFTRNKQYENRGQLVASSSIYMPELYSCMAPPLKPEVLREAGRFFHALLDWYDFDQEFAGESFKTFLYHMQRTTGHITLPDAQSINNILELLRPLRCLKHTYLVVEVEKGVIEKKVKSYWSDATNIPHKRIELVPTPSLSGRTRHWYGNANLKITRGHFKDNQQPLWEAIRFSTFMVLVHGDT
ncbi:site-specific integrase [Vreelandella zhanjiangensis]|uniref:site-specific integrase n=1 Tax=Vreelandella zhanjiangensis TaxID=1121960 RepID=UPI00402A922B